MSSKQIYTIFILTLITLLACKKDVKQNNEKLDTIPVDTVAKIHVEKNIDSLRIEGNQILLRDTPRNGNVIMKLNNDNLCTILDTSNADTLQGNIDYWYKITHNDTTGWVFGSRTNIKSESSKKTELFLTQMEIFITALRTKEFKIINAFIFPNEPVHCVLGSSSNDHLRTTITYDLKKTSEDYYDIQALLDSLAHPRFSKTHVVYSPISKKEKAHIYLKEGIYYEGMYKGNHPISKREKWQLDNGMIPDRDYATMRAEYPKYLKREKEVKFRVVIAYNEMGDDSNPYYEFYFYFREGKWYLSGIYHPYVN